MFFYEISRLIWSPVRNCLSVRWGLILRESAPWHQHLPENRSERQTGSKWLVREAESKSAFPRIANWSHCSAPKGGIFKDGLPSIGIPVQLCTKLAQQLHPGEGFVSLLCRVGAGSTSAHSAVPSLLLSRLLLLQSRSAATSAPRLLAVGRSPQGKCACRRWAAPRETTVSTCSTAAWLPITNRWGLLTVKCRLQGQVRFRMGELQERATILRCCRLLSTQSWMRSSPL